MAESTFRSRLVKRARLSIFASATRAFFFEVCRLFANDQSPSLRRFEAGPVRGGDAQSGPRSIGEWAARPDPQPAGEYRGVM